MTEAIVFGSILLLVGFIVGCIYTDNWHQRDKAKAEAAEVLRLAREIERIADYKHELWRHELEQEWLRIAERSR